MTWEALRLGPIGVWSVFILAWTEANVNKRISGRGCGCVRTSQEGWLPRASGAIRQGMNNLRRAVAPALGVILAVPLIAAAQGSAVPARVTDRVNLSQLTMLKGNTHALAQAKYDQGPAPLDLPMNRMLLVLQRSADQESALQNLLIQQQVTGSASFRKWLTPD